jgi:hypothetical protein
MSRRHSVHNEIDDFEDAGPQQDRAKESHGAPAGTGRALRLSCALRTPEEDANLGNAVRGA